jgi:hypothetical protein
VILEPLALQKKYDEGGICTHCKCTPDNGASPAHQRYGDTGEYKEKYRKPAGYESAERNAI